MSFSTGRATFLRFKLSGGAPPKLFDQDQLDRLAENQIGRQKVASADGSESGWTAGGHVLDTDFQLEKNVVNDALLFDYRYDRDAPPGDLLRAYYEVELKALTKANPSGKPSARQKREAKEIARDRVEQEAKDGRFKKRKTIPVLWHLSAGEVWFGATAMTHLDNFTALFERTFGLSLDALPAGRQAYLHAELTGQTRAVDDATLSPFVAGTTPADVAWIADSSSRDFLGNELLQWLWFYSDVESDTITVADGSEVTFMLAQTLALDCPRGVTGSESIRHEAPTRLSEARRAIQTGKLPRKAGVTLVRHGEQYEVSITAETLAVSGAKLPPPDEDVAPGRPTLEDRIAKLRSLVETLDLLYAFFLDRRLSGDWGKKDLARIQAWLGPKSS
jgi:hypothetical protein